MASQFLKMSVRRLLNMIPEDGCMLVFNASYVYWHNQVHKNGKLICTVLDRRQKYQAYRDLYVYWKD